LAELHLVGGHGQVQFFQYVLGRRNQFSLAIAYQLVGAAVGGRVDAAGHGEDLAVLLEGQAGRDEGAAVDVALDDEDAEAEGAEDAVAAREVLAARLRAEGVVADQAALLHDLLRQLDVLGRVDDVEATGEHGDGAAAGDEGRAVRDGVDAAGEAADDGDAVTREVGREVLGGLAAVGRGAPRADDGDGPLVLGPEVAADVEDGRPVVHLPEAERVGFVVPAVRLDAGLVEP